MKKPVAPELGARIKARRVLLRLSQTRLAEEVTKRGIKLSQQNVNSIESGLVARPRALPEIAAVLGTTIAHLTDGAPVAGGPSREVNPGSSSLVVNMDALNRQFDRSLFPLAEPTSEGHMIMAGGLKSERVGQFDAVYPFTLLMRGGWMSPAIETGDQIFVDPSLPVRINGDCVFIHEQADATLLVAVGRLIGISPDRWRIRQFTPLKDIDLPRHRWSRAFPIRLIARVSM